MAVLPQFRRTCIFFVLLLTASLAVAKEVDLEDKSNYLYVGDPQAEEYVHDYHPSKGASDIDEPGFLFDPRSPARVVEFYAPWCPHCQHFRNHYVQFAKQIRLLGQENEIDIQVHSVSCQAFKKICQRFNIHSYPKVFVYKPGAIANSSIRVDYWSLHPFDVLRELGIQTDHLHLEDVAGPDVKHQVPAHGSASYFDEFPRTKQNVYDDARLSLMFALKTGVFTSNQPLVNASKATLLEWLNLLHYSMPPTWRPVQNVVTGLLQDFDNVTQSEERLLSVIESHAGNADPKEGWSPSCVKGNPAMGYTCGLWQLFHIVTVGVVEWNLMLQTDDGERVVGTEEAALAIRNFVDRFFGCEVCKVNFVNAYDTCFLNRCHRLNDEMTVESWAQLPVWLWETHNAVNVRLLKEKYEREKVGRAPTPEEEIAVTWPSREDCPACWHADGGWDDTIIYKYLRLEYWPEDFVSKEYRELLFASAKQNPSDDDMAGGTPSALKSLARILVFSSLLGIAVGWHSKRMEVKRTGLHKKFDDSSHRLKHASSNGKQMDIV